MALRKIEILFSLIHVFIISTNGILIPSYTGLSAGLQTELHLYLPLEIVEWESRLAVGIYRISYFNIAVDFFCKRRCNTSWAGTFFSVLGFGRVIINTSPEGLPHFPFPIPIPIFLPFSSATSILHPTICCLVDPPHTSLILNLRQNHTHAFNFLSTSGYYCRFRSCPINPRSHSTLIASSGLKSPTLVNNKVYNNNREPLYLPFIVSTMLIRSSLVLSRSSQSLPGPITHMRPWFESPSFVNGHDILNL